MTVATAPKTKAPRTRKATIEGTNLTEMAAELLAKTPAPKAKASPKTKPPKAKAAPKPKTPKAAVERVSAEKVLETLVTLGMTRSEFAKRAGVSASLLSEWSGHGRKMAPTTERFALAVKTAKAAK